MQQISQYLARGLGITIDRKVDYENHWSEIYGKDGYARRPVEDTLDDLPYGVNRRGERFGAESIFDLPDNPGNNTHGGKEGNDFSDAQKTRHNVHTVILAKRADHGEL